MTEPSKQPVRRVSVMGVGNVLTGDDALGPYVLELLDAGYDFPAEVELQEVGTPGIDLTMYLEPLDALVVIDAVKAPVAPGTVKTYRKAQLLAAPLPVVMSPHEPTLREALLRLELLGAGPREVLLVGAVPGHLTLGGSLSAEVQAAVPVVARLVLEELERLGVPARSKATPRAATFWWERPQTPAEAS